jgi:hypothetical protein
VSVAETSAPATRRGGSPRAQLAVVLVLIGLAALAAYAMWSGPTTVPLPAGPPKAAPARTAPAHQEEPQEGRGD